MSIDINATDFVQSFDISGGTVGVIGHGFVGRAVDEFFKGKCKVLVNDLAKPDLQTLSEVVSSSEVIFVCVPTPMRGDGSCFTGYVEDVLSNIKEEAKRLSRNIDNFVVVVKSTVYPGFVEEMSEKLLPLRIVFSPEFLTEKNSVSDVKETNRIIVGGDEDDALVVCMYFAHADIDKIDSGKRIILQTDPTTAEMVKLYANGILAAKVIFSNEVYQVCQKLEVDYDEVRRLATLDERIGRGHTTVPGPDGQLGYGGHCFPKDISNLRAMCRKLDVKEKVLTAMIDRNDELREDKDWLKMVGRAVVDN